MKRKKHKFKKNIKYKISPQFIKDFYNQVSIENINKRYSSIKISSWFNIKEKDVKIKGSFETSVKYDKLEKVNYKTKQIILKPTIEQKDILLKWMEAFRITYNFAIFFLRKKNYTFYELRKRMKEIKYDIQKKYPSNIHILDRAIYLAISNKKSIITNIKNGNIDNYRLRYWRKNQEQKMIKIEKNEMNHIKLFKELKGYDEGKKFILYNAEAECTIKYNKYFNQFILHYPVKIEEKNINKTEKTISLDPGLRTFLTGISNDKSVKICDEIVSKLKPILLRIDKYQSKNELRKKRKYENKIKNIINDLHWKSIKYLTHNYDNIIIGNMSIKDIIRKENNKKGLHSISKRCLQNMSLYKFKLRLKYKCNTNNKKYKETDESYTSKTCSLCGQINENLGSNKKFNCNGCNIVMDRDINGARNIYLKSIYSV